MDEQTPEMERIDNQLRELMREWIKNPQNKELKERYTSLHNQYQRLFVEMRKSRNGVA